MKAVARVVGVIGMLLALIGVLGRMMHLRTLEMLGSEHLPGTYLVVGIVVLQIAIWLAVAFEPPKKKEP
jgi:hypothetical protein